MDNMSITIACIGSGNMGFALIRGICGLKAGTIGDVEIGFSDIDGKKAKAAAAALAATPFGEGSPSREGVVYDSNIEAAEKGDYIFLAVKPQVLGGVLEEIGLPVRRRLATGSAPVLVSMAAGWSIDKIQAAIAGVGAGPLPAARVPVARIMPNTPALVSKGLIALAVSPELDEAKIATLETMLSGAGTVDRIDEHYLNAVTGLSGSGPAFAYLFIEALADGGVFAGLPRDKALRYAAQTVLGSAAMVMETGKHPGELKDMVASPAGTTIAGIAALEAGAFRGTVMDAVRAAWQRATELG
jgi:pyrroline-5-carboxylate reductase